MDNWVHVRARKRKSLAQTHQAGHHHISCTNDMATLHDFQISSLKHCITHFLSSPPSACLLTHHPLGPTRALIFSVSLGLLPSSCNRLCLLLLGHRPPRHRPPPTRPHHLNLWRSCPCEIPHTNIQSGALFKHTILENLGARHQFECCSKCVHDYPARYVLSISTKK